MPKLISIVTASALALLGASSLAAASGSATTKGKIPAVVPVLGPMVDVPVGQFVQAFAYCPKGYYVTGGGAVQRRHHRDRLEPHQRPARLVCGRHQQRPTGPYLPAPGRRRVCAWQPVVDRARLSRNRRAPR